MLAEDLGGKTDRLIGRDGTIGSNIQCKLVKVCLLSDTGILYSDVDSLYRCVDGVDRDDTDFGVGRFVLVGADITSSFCDGQLNEQLGILAAQCSDHKIRIHDLDVLIHLNIGSAHDSFSLTFNISSFRLIGLTDIADGKALDVHDDFRHVFLNTGNGAELVLYAVNLDLADSSSGK